MREQKDETKNLDGKKNEKSRESPKMIFPHHLHQRLVNYEIENDTDSESVSLGADEINNKKDDLDWLFPPEDPSKASDIPKSVGRSLRYKEQSKGAGKAETSGKQGKSNEAWGESEETSGKSKGKSGRINGKSGKEGFKAGKGKHGKWREQDTGSFGGKGAQKEKHFFSNLSGRERIEAGVINVLPPPKDTREFEQEPETAKGKGKGKKHRGKKKKISLSSVKKNFSKADEDRKYQEGRTEKSRYQTGEKPEWKRRNIDDRNHSVDRHHSKQHLKSRPTAKSSKHTGPDAYYDRKNEKSHITFRIDEDAGEVERKKRGKNDEGGFRDDFRSKKQYYSSERRGKRRTPEYYSPERRGKDGSRRKSEKSRRTIKMDDDETKWKQRKIHDQNDSNRSSIDLGFRGRSGEQDKSIQQHYRGDKYQNSRKRPSKTVPIKQSFGKPNYVKQEKKPFKVIFNADKRGRPRMFECDEKGRRTYMSASQLMDPKLKHRYNLIFKKATNIKDGIIDKKVRKYKIEVEESFWKLK